MEILAVIPARGGSKGVPRKNIRSLAGEPLIAYSIETAKRASKVNRIIVSTDDPEIGEISERYGAQVVFRPAAISGDDSLSEDALLHVLNNLQREESFIPDLLVFLQCTSPLTTPDDIDGTIEALLEQNADTALAVTPFHYFLWKVDENGDAFGLNHNKNIRELRQNRGPQFLETGSVYVMKAEKFILEKHRFFGKTALHEIPPERCLEIDDEIDFIIADVLIRKRREQEKGEIGCLHL